jgi:Calcineurin-like phosphoesterase
MARPRKTSDPSFPPPPRPRRFGVPAQPAAAQFHKSHGFRANQAFQPLPPPTGAYPYRFSLDQVLSADEMAGIGKAGELVFHVAGDTGGVKSPESQQIVAMYMEQDVTSLTPAPAFFYHLGDVVYYNGQRADYYSQFYEPYAQYPLPILGIPGNHDGDPLDPLAEPSLTAFVETFCSSQPHVLPEAQEVQRDTMTQPNVYFTLLTPFATIIGLYSNVPEGGRMDADQIAWLQSEVAAAPADVALIVAVHHPVYSADAHHGGSQYVGQVLDTAFAGAARVPDLVLTGHVHNYQRFTRSKDGRQVPYVVAGAGGYWNLHYMAKDANGQDLPTPWQTPDPEVALESYVEDRHGFLRLTASHGTVKGEYLTVPRPQESWRSGPFAVQDTFTLDLAAHTVS